MAKAERLFPIRNQSLSPREHSLYALRREFRRKAAAGLSGYCLLFDLIADPAGR